MGEICCSCAVVGHQKTRFSLANFDIPIILAIPVLSLRETIVKSTSVFSCIINRITSISQIYIQPLRAFRRTNIREQANRLTG